MLINLESHINMKRIQYGEAKKNREEKIIYRGGPSESEEILDPKQTASRCDSRVDKNLSLKKRMECRATLNTSCISALSRHDWWICPIKELTALTHLRLLLQETRFSLCLCLKTLAGSLAVVCAVEWKTKEKRGKNITWLVCLMAWYFFVILKRGEGERREMEKSNKV